MDQSPLPAPPCFNPEQLRIEFTAIYREGRGNDSAVRQKILERLKQLWKSALEQAEAQLCEDGNGRGCAEGLSRFQDELIHLIYDFAITHIYRATNPSDAERMAVIATGGYGRGLLAPGSDIDLLFLHPYKLTPWAESVVEYILYLLWDVGFKVGHATRSVDQCIKLSRADMTIRTALLDARLIFGDETLFGELQEKFASGVVAGTAREFIEAKMSEREERHERSGASRYRVEPNIKDGKGGLRDLHTLHWLAKYIHGDDPGAGVLSAGIFTPDEFHTFRKCEDFLWTVRCHLHFVTGRAEERLAFELQPILAERLGYTAHDGLIPAERFMKHYFLVAKDVGDLTGILCSALEMQQLKTSPGIDALLSPGSWRLRRKIAKSTDFRVENGRLNVVNDKVFLNDPVNLIRIFAQAEEYDLAFHPEAVRLLRRSLRLIDNKLRKNKEANRIFLKLLCAKTNPEGALRRMNEAGVLGRFIPEFGRVVSMMQFNMYHHFTVDEHLLRTVGMLSRIDRGLEAETHPLSTKIINLIQHKRALYVAAFLHDIGKGRPEDHSLIGAELASRICPRLGLNASETQTVVWLVREHLTMSNTAQSRDLSEPKTIRDFANVVQSPERLKLLLILTVVDIRAVGPGTWNGWKGQLLRALYTEAEALLSGGHSKLPHKERVEQAKQDLRAALADWPLEKVEAFIADQYRDYWLKIETKSQARHAMLMQQAEQNNQQVVTDHVSDAFTAITELSVLAPNHPRLLSMCAGACAASGANISGAYISTTRSGVALNTFLLAREFDFDDDEERRARRIGQTIEKLLRGELHLSRLMAGKDKPAGSVGAFTVEPEVIINNALSDSLTVIEVAGLDRPGLLFELTSALADLNIDIASAHITTFGEKAVDVFYVTDLTGKKIENKSRQRRIHQTLTGVLSITRDEQPIIQNA